VFGSFLIAALKRFAGKKRPVTALEAQRFVEGRLNSFVNPRQDPIASFNRNH
jgi:hypothetical protein